ncbi:UMP-CMP kinase-like isoform X4 [Humulus lupulus]|uniref:UMP-CMP kinase-like isoform X4 n=1 Tax=Humulus lupulus TaxID=3486 RepID=UPI002B404FBA|nr:UMP-CMP kinase-like isoform X4 [Humulus lupulus]
MWRHVALLSPLVSSSKPSILNQGVFTFKFWETFATEAKPFITFVLGGPSSGKGTQCKKIIDTYGFKHLSAGDLLRREIASKSEYGSMILNTIREGKIVPSQVTVKLIQREMKSSDNKRFLIDGFPQSEENRVAFEKITGAEPNLVLFFDCPEEEMVKRVLNRNQINAVGNVVEIFEQVRPIFASGEVTN